MQVTIEINGRQAVPVRAIPLLTDWRTLSPDQLAQILAGDSDSWPSFDGLTSYRLHVDGTESIPPRWWASWVVRKLKAISEAIEATQTSHETGYQQWRRESLAHLPAGVFVWCDEFEKAYVREYGPESLRARFNRKTFDPSAYVLDFNPQPDPTIAPAHLVMEGFGTHIDSGAKVLTEQEAAEQAVGWWDATMDAAVFFSLGHVLPVEAAILLCGQNPHQSTEQDAEVMTRDPNSPDEIKPDDFKRLRRTFVDLQHMKPGNRSLIDWMRAAVEAGRRVHPWAYEYAEYRGLWPSAKPMPSARPLNEAPTPDEPALSAQTAPDGLATAQIATIFAGLPYTAKNWPKRLSDTNWPLTARLAQGAVGGATALWCPATLAKLIHAQAKTAEKQKRLEALNRRFKNTPELAPWRDDWNKHYELFSDAD